MSPTRYWVDVSDLSAILRNLPVPKNTHTSPVSSKVTVGLEVIGPRYAQPALVLNVSSISVGVRLAPEAMPQVEVEQGAALHVPIVSRYILPVQYPMPLEARIDRPSHIDCVGSEIEIFIQRDRIGHERIP